MSSHQAGCIVIPRKVSLECSVPREPPTLRFIIAYSYGVGDTAGTPGPEEQSHNGGLARIPVFSLLVRELSLAP